MKVLLLFSSSELGGAERSLTRAVLSANGAVQYTLATLDGHGRWVDWCHEQKYEPVVFGARHAKNGGHSRFGLAEILRVVAHIRLHRYAAIYVIGLRAALWLRFLRPWLRGSKLVQGVRWNPCTNSRLDLAFLFIERIFGIWIDLYICNSRNTADTIKKRVGIREEKVKVVYNGLEQSPLLLPPYSERSISVVTLANINPRKGYFEFLKVIPKILRRFPDVHFYFVGRDDMDGLLAAKVVELGLDRAITITGYQSNVEPWLCSARLMVLPSLWGEGCPTSILEGYVFGLPVVAYSIDGIPELINNGIDGLLVTPGKPVELTDAILSILNDPVQAERMAASGRSKVLTRFTLRHCTVGHDNIFSELLLGRQRNNGVLG